MAFFVIKTSHALTSLNIGLLQKQQKLKKRRVSESSSIMSKQQYEIPVYLLVVHLSLLPVYLHILNLLD